VYATHGLGPVAQAFDIHRGDRMVTLVAMDTKSVVGKDLVELNLDNFSVCRTNQCSCMVAVTEIITFLSSSFFYQILTYTYGKRKSYRDSA